MPLSGPSAKGQVQTSAQASGSRAVLDWTWYLDSEGVNHDALACVGLIDTGRCWPWSAAHMSSTVSLTDLQLAIVRILWERGECTVLEVQEALAPERKLAQTTVATILTRLEKRRIVRHQANGRLFVYKALVTEPQVRRSMVSDLTDLLFDGSPAALITHLLSEKEFDSNDLDEVKRLIADAERGGNGDASR